jgi:CheY-like chemotaxis protein
MLLVKSRVWRCLEGGSYCEIRPMGVCDDHSSTVLVVDDNDMNREILCRRMEKFGHRHMHAVNGQEALDQMRGNTIDLVLLDINMPVMDGMEVLKSMKADCELRNIPVIMISANSDSETIHACLALGADDYVTKPFNATILKSRMTPLLKIKRKADLERLRDEQLQALSSLGEQFR